MAIVAILLSEGREKRAAIGGRIVLARREPIFCFWPRRKSVPSPVSSAIVEKDQEDRTLWCALSQLQMALEMTAVACQITRRVLSLRYRSRIDERYGITHPKSHVGAYGFGLWYGSSSLDPTSFLWSWVWAFNGISLGTGYSWDRWHGLYSRGISQR